MRTYFRLMLLSSMLVPTFFFISPLQAMDLEEFLTAVKSKHKLSQVVEVQKQAAELRQTSGDISLVPVLTAGTYFIQDKSPLNQFASLGAKEVKVTDFNLGFAQKFDTGTSLALSVDVAEYNNSGVTGPFAQLATGSLGVSLSQSLWKDFFGEATRLRRQTTSVSTQAEKGRYDLQLTGLLISAEQAYWNYLVAAESVKIGRESLERAKKIESWTKRRVSDGISEKSDLLQTQALVAARQLALISAEDELAATTQALKDFLELDAKATLPAMTGSLSSPRIISSLLKTVPSTDAIAKSKILTIDTYLSGHEAKARALAADQVEDAYKSDLTLSAAYQTHSFEKDNPGALGQITSTDRPTTKVALNWTYLLDSEVKSAARSSSRKDALAAKLMLERKILESESSWSELNRRNSEILKQIEIADQVTKIQEERAKAEAALFNKGRSITANVVNAEEDAATAKLNLTRLKSAQRKIEAQGRIFVITE